MVTKQVEKKEPKKQDTMTFQPKGGYRAIMDQAIEDETYGDNRSYSYIINKALKLLFETDDLLPKPKK